ncbi:MULTISPECIES: RNA polymerase subunit sigma-24 [unclassified Rhodococcus (in: high G+C Gram-positive bacteria)]|uniref:RNA polymerase subunit sigma-24 n=1 Tax=unclassified Rhodococcus (in: high G+C Gram-positive bacteria) TaxID=192944 RepID=UPI00146F7638|nr:MULTISPECIES: RNA polymerase subunit sigma-24 [unclassified Rhodococcus (in: high G+C Gram-positive bacteria)]MBF0661630.1 RNA polymerase subunit sigma-24 [Rhodococcus sp. (in: high G+C Gram-positive bacteria)]NME79686.1 RNA polymerase subunit sigma-24 [Rhodococcus sp. 105337]
MTAGGRAPVVGAGRTSSNFTACDLAWSVAAGDAAALPVLLRELHPAVSAYSRARAKHVGYSFSDADRLALEACRSILTALSAPSGADRPFLRLAYSLAAETADTRFAVRRDAPLTRLQQDILILRTIVGLDPEQTAVAMALTPRRVRVEQHAALSSLRAA